MRAAPGDVEDILKRRGRGAFRSSVRPREACKGVGGGGGCQAGNRSLGVAMRLGGHGPDHWPWSLALVTGPGPGHWPCPWP